MSGINNDVKIACNGNVSKKDYVYWKHYQNQIKWVAPPFKTYYKTTGVDFTGVNFMSLISRPIIFFFLCKNFKKSSAGFG
jgi:hypothetical protein